MSVASRQRQTNRMDMAYSLQVHEMVLDCRLVLVNRRQDLKPHIHSFQKVATTK